MSEKVVGYILLGIGIFVMMISVGYVWLAFTNKIQPVQVIEAKSLTLDLSSALGAASAELAGLPGLGSGGQSSSGIEILSGKDMSRTLNLSITFFLMTFVMLFGFRIASLGVMLMRPIVVKMKESSIASASNQNVTGTSS